MLLKLSKKEIAAIEAALDIALNGGGALVQSADITARQGIPPRYLEPILQKLGRAGVLVGVRGPGGGYRLARERRRITLWQLVDAMRGEAEAEVSASLETLAHALADIETDLRARLDAVTIEELCWGKKPPERGPRRDFVI
ncbi:MAG: Rrf2 family transcriptional regulator [Alphaproteobacteria bacterium]|nr:Rrf2 family transcriptional regulator [Alphaproteobacteria bacterium]